MSSQQECFDLLFLLAGRQFCISIATREIDRGIVISVIAVATDPTAERLLIGSIRAVNEMATRTLLRGVSSLDRVRGPSAFGSRPSKLLRDMRQVGSI